AGLRCTTGPPWRAERAGSTWFSRRLTPLPGRSRAFAGYPPGIRSPDTAREGSVPDGEELAQAGAKVHVVRLDRHVLLPGLDPPVVRTREPVGGSGRRLPVPDPEVLTAVAEQVPLTRMGELDLLVGAGLGRGELLRGRRRPGHRYTGWRGLCTGRD